MKKIIILLLIGSAVFWYVNKGPENVFSKSKKGEVSSPIPWGSDIGQGLRKAKSEDKMVMIDFYADWCHWCHKLDETTYQEGGVVSLVNENFVSVKIDGERKRNLVKKYKVQGYPNITFLNKNGEIIYQLPGYLPPKEFRELLEEVIKTGNV